jgi:hypothetical protein
MIYCIGDSFTFGAELPKADGGTNTPGIGAWPSLLSEKLNHPVTNLGKGGCGNTRIIKRAIDCVLQFNKDPIIIAWTNPMRVEFIDKEGLFDIWPGRPTIRMISARHSITEEITKIYNKNTDYWAYRKWLRDIIMLQTFFKYHNHPYLMLQSHVTQQMNTEFDQRDEFLKSQIDQSTFIGWPYEGIVEWIGDCPRGPQGHPLELGHQRITEKIYEHIRNINWLS